MNQYKLTLLKSILEKPKFLDMGKSPVSAIQAAFQMLDEGLITQDTDGYLHITQKGRCEVVNNMCPHLNVTVYWRLYARETRYEPAEYIGKAQCEDCGEWMEPEDVPDEAEKKEVNE